jgi:hypothetical protein
MNEITDFANVSGVVEVKCEGWPVSKYFVIRGFAGCPTVTDAVRDAARIYKEHYDVDPSYAFVKSLPRGVENGVEVDGVMLFEAEWMAARCVAVGWIYK